ncbi:pulmonary surfactant-associated protein B-like [Hemiscyllium ocellatum]|uniref:pulmonary surfactant-associated protein B-like n=1 Tax=Hemiscyllium ocellatum TaxID=170820 RepID=UPI002966E2E4|nr:pulmonary surfactant-associated protein B-like [Hemiscyllium ocellatum]
MALRVLLVLYCLSPVLASFEWNNKTCFDKTINPCQNLRSAVKCNVVHHCAKTSWSQAKVKDDICELCKKFVRVVAEMVKDKTVQDAVENALHEGCNLIPVKQFADECNDVVNTYLPIIIQLLEEELEPDSLCAALGLCKSLKEGSLSNRTAKIKTGVDSFSPKSNEVWKRIRVPLPKDKYTCDSCVIVLKKLQRLLPEERTEVAIATLPRQVCSRLTGKYLAKCRDFMERFGDTAIDLLFREVQPGAVCETLHVCSTVDSKEPSLPIVPCDMCEAVARQFKVAQNKGTRTDLVLQEVCNPFSDISNFVCEEFVYSHIPLLTTIPEYPEDFDLCGALHICTRKVDAHFDRNRQPV